MKINQAKLKYFLDANILYWSKYNNKKTLVGNCIVVNNDTQLSLGIGKYTTAKALELECGYNATVVSHSCDKDRDKVSCSFGFGFTSFNKPFHFIDAFGAFLQAAIWVLCKMSGESLLKVKYKGVLIGDLIYDTMVITRKDVYTVTNLGQRRFLIDLMKGIYIARRGYKLCNALKPKAIVISDMIYNDAIIVRFARQYGAEVFCVTSGRPNIHLAQKYNDKPYSPDYHHLMGDMLQDYITAGLPKNWEQEADNRIEAVFSGQGDWNTENAFKGKVVDSKSNILKEIGIQNNNPIVIIMSHCFSDAPHCGGEMLYSDYYDWLEKTLDFVCNIKDVNWILKAHPGRLHYGEEGIVESIFKKYRADNLFWMPERFSAAVIPVLANLIVTVNGTAGQELSCKGIPCVNSGYASYTRFGFTYQPKSISEYEQMLKNVSCISCLTSEQIISAKKVLYSFYKIWYLLDDNLQKLAYSNYQKLFKNGNEEECNDEFSQIYVELLADLDFHSTYAWQYVNEINKRDNAKRANV